MEISKKVRLFIIDYETGNILAGQRNAILICSTESDNWNINADSMFMESDEAYEALSNAFLQDKAVKVRLEFSPGRKYTGSCTIKKFIKDIPYNDLAQYSLILQGDRALPIDELDSGIL